MFNQSISLSQVMSQIARAENEMEFQRALDSLKSSLKYIGIDPGCLLEVERRAFYLSNTYSEKDTREKMEQAKKRIQEYINEMMDISMKDKQVMHILENFYLFLESLIEREPHGKSNFKKEQLEMLKIKNEYDVQHLLYAYLKPLYPMVRTEVSEDTGYSAVRVDIALDAENVIEVKCTRKGMAQKKLVEEIEADMVHYNAQSIYFFIYDKAKILENPLNFKSTYEKKLVNKHIYIVIHQPKLL